MSAYNRDYRRQGREDDGDEEESGGQRHIQAYYDDDGYSTRSNTSHWRSNSRRDSGYAYGYSYGHGNNNWNQSYSAWVPDGHPDATYYAQGEYDTRYDNYEQPSEYDTRYDNYEQSSGYDTGYNNYEQPWYTDGYAYSERRYAPRNRHEAPRDYERPRHRERERKQNLPPAEAPPRSPSPSYLATSLSPSGQADPAPRKLVILDLNGTLLFRSKPPRRSGPVVPLQRTVHARPYLASLREYLFHPATKRWLDVMIWSSAQPHSVRDMLQHCFPVPGAEKSSPDERFIAVWARDTLGLSSVDYSRKTQTIKDLRKPWRELVSPDDAGAGHSARTTVLLDDSPRKACLQPWNHVCVPEYDGPADAHAVATEPGAPDPEVPSVPTTAPATLDCTLLAVIGILDALQCESNVAAWIRAGGLCALGERRVEGDEAVRSEDSAPPAKDRSIDSNLRVEGVSDAKVVRPDDVVAEAEAVAQTTPTSLGKRARDKDDAPASPPAKRARDGEAHALSPGGPAESAPSPRTRAASPATPPPSSAPQPASPSSPASPFPPVSQPSNAAKSQAVVSREETPQWFAHPPTLALWIARGRAALHACGIAEVAGDPDVADPQGP